jgi:transposase-like protein
MGSSKPWKDKEKLKELYVEKKLSTYKIADKFGCSAVTVNKWLKKHGIELRSSGEGSKIAYSRKPAPIKDTANGYEIWRDKSGDKDNGVFVHRLLYVAYHGVESVKNKDVHHQNEVPWDNRIENLEALTKSEHRLLHANNNNKDAKWKNEELMRELYVKKKKSTCEISEKFGCSAVTVNRWLKKHGIRVRSRSEAQTA